jgi:hypothetical protein
VRRHVGPAATGFEPGLNTLNDLPPEAQQLFETFFWQKLDDVAARALSLLVEGKTLTDAPLLREGWAGFLVSLRMRHPEALPEIKVFVNRVWNTPDQRIEKEYEERFRRAGDPPTFDEFIAMNKPYTVANIRFGMIIGAVKSERLRKLIKTFTWTVINVSSSPSPLLTSDWPIEIDTAKDRFISLPLSPSRLFLASDDYGSIRTALEQPRAKLVEIVNKLLVCRARRHVFACDDTLDEFIRENMGTEVAEPPFFPTLLL